MNRSNYRQRMYQAHVDLLCGFIHSPTLRKVINCFHHVRRNTVRNLNFINGSNRPLNRLGPLAYVHSLYNLLCVVDKRPGFRSNIQNTSSPRHPLIVHIGHEPVEYLQNVFSGKHCFIRCFTESGIISKELGNQICVHFREFLLLVEYPGNIRNARYLVRFLNVTGMYQGSPCPVICHSERRPGICIITLLGSDGVPVTINTPGCLDRGNFNHVGIYPSVPPVVRCREQSSEIKNIRELLLQTTLILYCIIQFCCHLDIPPILSSPALSISGSRN